MAAIITVAFPPATTAAADAAADAATITAAAVRDTAVSVTDIDRSCNIFACVFVYAGIFLRITLPKIVTFE